MSKKGKPLYYDCDDCEELFAIVIRTNNDVLPETCPFCGSYLDNSKYIVTEMDDTED